MAAAKKAAKKTTAKKAPAKKAAAKKTTAKKAPAKKAPAKKAAAKKTTAKKTTAKRTAASSAAGVKVPVSQIKERIKAAGLRTSGDFADALNEEVNALIDRAAKRAEGNGRSTVRPGDL